MSKELEALENIKNREILIDIEMTDTFYNDCEDLHDSFNIIETKLKDYEETDNQIYNLFKQFGINTRKDLLKQLKALATIKEHFVNIGGTKGNFEDEKPTNEIVIALKDLTKENFDFLEEEL